MTFIPFSVKKQDQSEFRKRYPNLLAELTELDLALPQILVLDVDPDVLGNQIRRAFEDLKYQTLDFREKNEFPIGDPPMKSDEARRECMERLVKLQKQVEMFRRQLGEDYRKTYE